MVHNSNIGSFHERKLPLSVALGSRARGHTFYFDPDIEMVKILLVVGYIPTKSAIISLLHSKSSPKLPEILKMLLRAHPRPGEFQICPYKLCVERIAKSDETCPPLPSCPFNQALLLLAKFGVVPFSSKFPSSFYCGLWLSTHESIHTSSFHSCSVLSQVVYLRMRSVLKLFISIGVDMKAPDAQWAFHYALTYDKIDCTKLLFASGSA